MIGCLRTRVRKQPIIALYFESENELKFYNLDAWLQECDLTVADRGFRDLIDLLQSIGFRTEMPEYLSKGQKQHSREEAYHFRLVTKTRWFVESANG